jgi:DNA recombination protein RmuC
MPRRAGTQYRVCKGRSPLSRHASGIDLHQAGGDHFHMSLTVAAFVAATVAGVFVWLIMRARSATLAERARQSAAALAQAGTELSALRTRVTELTAERAALGEAQTRLLEAFKALSADALRANNQSFLSLARETFGQLHQQSVGELEKRQQAIDSLVQPLRASLERVGQSVVEIDKLRADAYGRLSEQLKSLGTAQILLQAEAAKLSTALRSTTAAGTWGELQLRRVVELAGLSAYCDFTEQPVAGDLRPDLVVRLPGGQRIVVDAKAPNDAFREAVNAPDEPTRTLKLAEHAAKVRTHLDALGAKNYWEQFQPSPEFVVLFLPGDQFLAGALQSDPTLLDRGIGKKVLLATPATLIALLKAAAYGWRQEDVARNAAVIADLGRTLYDRLATFADHLDKVGRSLDSANRSYNSAVGSFEQTLLPGARKFAELGAKGTKDLADPTPVEAIPREVLKRA